MAETRTTSAGSDAIERLRPLLAGEFRERELGPDGYLDLLDGEAPMGGISNRLMVSRALPQVYERFWRPGFGKLLMGVTGPGMAEEARIARLMMSLGPGDGVLDVACGPANFTRGFARAVGPAGLAVGIDASVSMLERGVHEVQRESQENVVLVRGDATNLPFRDQSFDAVCCFGALYLIDDPLAALDEMTRVLNRGGRIAVMTSVRRQATPRPVSALLSRLVGARIFERDEITGALGQRGYTDVHQRVSGLAQFVGGRLPG